jgi:protein EFR3
MVESSISTFEAFCEHHDGASLSADQEYLRQYEEIVRTYAAFASTRPSPVKTPRSAPIAMRWRVVGLQAVKSVVSSEALGSVAGRQLDVIMPILLENLWTDNYDYLEVLEQRAEMEEKVDVEKLLKRRASVATVRTVETSDTNPAAVSGTTADADKLAEEDIGVLAIQCLKQLFVVNNRSQVRTATVALFRFIADRVAQKEMAAEALVAGEDRCWPIAIFLMIARWTPVQDRYVILVTAMEKLIRSPLTEGNIPQQLVLATMVDSLLKSNVNLIGLSVMDVLLGLIQHVLRILQLGGVDPHHQQRITTNEGSPSKGHSKNPSPSTSTVGPPIIEITPSTLRKELLNRLQQCIGDLATHVYYADQISDMISAILLRLKPSPLSAIPNPAAAIEDPETTTNVLSASANLVEDPNMDGFFSFATAKATALKAIKSVLLVATKAKMSGGATLGRNRVGLRVWEGTQWLLRDPDGRVRKAYVDALLTWLDREITVGDLRVFEDKSPHSSHKEQTKNGNESTVGTTKRAVSSASYREKPSKPPRTTFLQLLHLAVYENATQYIDSEPDVVLLHLLLTALIEKLGVNAIRSGLPMIFRLQEDIQEVETMAKVRVGSLCHGYFWALSEKFDFESSGIGREIQNEIIRRRGKGIWVDMVRVPPVHLDHIGTPGQAISQDLPLSWQELESESLKPYDDRMAMIELISLAYSESMLAVSGSPPTSPGRSFSNPVPSTNLKAPSLSAHEIPPAIRDQMLSDWSREAVIAGVHEASKTVSLNGSRAGTGSGPQRNFLTVNGHFHNGGTNSGTQSPGSHQHQHRSRPPSNSAAYGLLGGIGPAQKLRKTSPHGGSPIAASDSSRNSVTRVEQLKRILSGQGPPSRDLAQSDTSSESMMSYDVPVSEVSFENRHTANNDIAHRASNEGARSKSRDRLPGPGEHLNPLGSNPVILGTESVALRDSEAVRRTDLVPPVPPLPTTLALPGAFPTAGSQERLSPVGSTKFPETSSKDTLRSGRGATRGLKSKGEHGSSWANEENPPVDLESLLKGIDTDGNGHGLVNRIGKGKGEGNSDIAKPPY